jgi:hypothetical protein
MPVRPAQNLESQSISIVAVANDADVAEFFTSLALVAQLPDNLQKKIRQLTFSGGSS